MTINYDQLTREQLEDVLVRFDQLLRDLIGATDANIRRMAPLISEGVAVVLIEWAEACVDLQREARDDLRRICDDAAQTTFPSLQ